MEGESQEEKPTPSLEEGTGGDQRDSLVAAALRAELADVTSELESQRQHNRVLKESLKRQRDITSNLVCKVEAEEENITLTLVKRLNQLRKEKEELAVSVEAEEEFVVNKLMKRLEVLRKEKIEIEMVMEKEQEAMVNKLLRERDAALAEIKQLRNLRHSSVTSPRSSSTIRSPSSHSSTPPNLNSASALAGAAAVSFDSATLGEASSGNVISEQDSAPKGDESLSSSSDNCRRLRRILSFVDRLIASNRTLGIVVEQQQHRSRSWSRDTTDKGDRDKDDGGNEKEESKQKKETTMSDDGDQLEREILARLNRLTLDSNAHRRDVLRLGNEAFVLRQRLQQERRKLQGIQTQRAALEVAGEMQVERVFNHAGDITGTATTPSSSSSSFPPPTSTSSHSLHHQTTMPAVPQPSFSNDGKSGNNKHARKNSRNSCRGRRTEEPSGVGAVPQQRSPHRRSGSGNTLEEILRR